MTPLVALDGYSDLTYCMLKSEQCMAGRVMDLRRNMKIVADNGGRVELADVR